MVKRWSVTDGQRETHHVSHKQPTNQSRAMQRDTDTTNHMLRGVTQIKPIKSHATSCERSTQVPDQLSRATHHTLWDRQRYSSCVIALLFPSADNDSVQKWYLLEMSINFGFSRHLVLYFFLSSRWSEMLQPTTEVNTDYIVSSCWQLTFLFILRKCVDCL